MFSSDSCTFMASGIWELNISNDASSVVSDGPVFCISERGNAIPPRLSHVPLWMCAGRSASRSFASLNDMDTSIPSPDSTIKARPVTPESFCS